MPTGRAVIIGCWPPGGADGGGSCLPHSRLLVLLPWRKEPCGGSARGHGRCVAPPWQGHLPLVQIGGLGRALHWVHRAPERRSYGGRLARFGLDQNVCGDHVTTTPAFSTYSTAIAQIRRPGSRRSRPPVWRGRACGRRARRGAQVPGAVTAAGRGACPACEASRCPWWASGKAASAPGRRGTCAYLAVLAVPRMCCGSMCPGSLQLGGLPGPGGGGSGAGLAPGPGVRSGRSASG